MKHKNLVLVMALIMTTAFILGSCGKGYKQIFGYLIFLAVVLLVGALFKNSVTRENKE